VIEGGTGAGAATIALLIAVGPRWLCHFVCLGARILQNACVAERGRIFRRRADWDRIKVRDLYAGFDRPGCDRIFMDLAECRCVRLRSRRRRFGRSSVLVWLPCRLRVAAKYPLEAIHASHAISEMRNFETVLRIGSGEWE